jgi:hypothetical protein
MPVVAHFEAFSAEGTVVEVKGEAADNTAHRQALETEPEKIMCDSSLRLRALYNDQCPLLKVKLINLESFPYIIEIKFINC